MSTSYYGLSSFTGTLPNAGNLTATGGGSSVADTTGTETLNFNGFGWIRISPRGGSETIQGALPANGTGHGWMLDNASLDGTTIPAGDWHILFSLICNLVSAVGQINVRVWKLDPSGPTYTYICDLASAAGQTVNTTHTPFTLTATSVGAVTFATGERLYFEILWNQSSGGNASNLTSVQVASTSSGVAGTTGLELQVPSGGSGVVGGGSLVANAALVESSAGIVNAGPIAMAANAALVASASVATPAAAMAANAALSLSAAAVSPSSAALQANAALRLSGAQIIAHSLALIANAILHFTVPTTVGFAALSDARAQGSAALGDADAQGAIGVSDV